MEFDEQSNSGFPVALSTPGQSNVTEKGIDRRLAYSLEPCTRARLHAPGLTKADVDSAVMVFSVYCTQTLATHSATPLPSSRTIH